MTEDPPIRGERGCRIVPMRPSSFIAIDPEAAWLRAAAEALDPHILKLIRAITAHAVPADRP